MGDKQNKLQGMDTQILIDALAVIMGHEEKELCKPGNLALVLILETATTILGSKERVGDDLRVGGGYWAAKRGWVVIYGLEWGVKGVEIRVE